MPVELVAMLLFFASLIIVPTLLALAILSLKRSDDIAPSPGRTSRQRRQPRERSTRLHTQPHRRF